MKNSIRCCISCILPCGALDVIRIVHSNGHVEEISGSNIKASEIMKAYPKHVLKKPTSSSLSDIDGSSSSATAADVPKIVVVPPDAELQRGKIYFLMPAPSTVPPGKKSKSSSTMTKKKRKDNLNNENNSNSCGGGGGGHNRQRRHSRSMSNKNSNNSISMANNNFAVSDQYLSEILSENSKLLSSTQRDRRSRGRVAVWRPNLESISESTSNNDG